MQIEIIKFIQQIANPFWDGFFTLISILGEEVFLIALLGFIYWCYDKRMGYKVGFLYALNAPLNFALKAIFNAPRPIGSEGVRTIYEGTATGSSFPSGHSQLGGGLFYFLFKNSKQQLLKAICLVIAFLIPISRLYLGVHFPVDVVVGLALGIMMVYISDWIFEMLFENHAPWLMLFALPPFIYCLVTGDEDGYKMAGLVIAFIIGMIIEKKYIDFHVKAKPVVQAVKYILGVAVVLLLRGILKAVLPAGAWSGFIRYFVIGVFVTIIYPCIIKKLISKE